MKLTLFEYYNRNGTIRDGYFQMDGGDCYYVLEYDHDYMAATIYPANVLFGSELALLVQWWMKGKWLKQPCIHA